MAQNNWQVSEINQNRMISKKKGVNTIGACSPFRVNRLISWSHIHMVTDAEHVCNAIPMMLDTPKWSQRVLSRCIYIYIYIYIHIYIYICMYIYIYIINLYKSPIQPCFLVILESWGEGINPSKLHGTEWRGSKKI